MKKFKKNNKNKGISLIALVVTIIVMIILVGIGIMYIGGNSGMINRTISARETHTKQAIRESLNLELHNILTEHISSHKETSKERSLDEFGKLNYDVEKEEDADKQNVNCYIIEQGYVFEIEEREDGYQEVVFKAQATKMNPKIIDVQLSIEDSKLKIVTNAKRADKYTYIISSNDKLKEETTDTSNYEIDLKELDKKTNKNMYGEFSVKVIAKNDNNKWFTDDSPQYNKTKTINVSRIVFDADGGKFEDNEDKFIAFVEKGKKINTITGLSNPTQNHKNFDKWNINGEEVNFEEYSISDFQVTIMASWIGADHEWVLARVIRETTCTESGEKIERCTLCGDERTIVEVALGHDYSEDFITDTEPTCTEKGEKSRHCTRCIVARTDVTEIEAKGHSYGEYAVTTPASCTEDGVETAYCTVCNNPKTRAIAALGHTPGPEATCINSQVCTVCGTVLQAASGAHDYGDWTLVTVAKCETKGSEKRVCKRAGCGDTQTRDITALGHDWGDYVTTKAATCSATGVETSTCKRTGCGKTRTNTLATNSNHSYATSLSKKDNTNHGYKCTLCGNAWSSLSSHSWGGWTKYSSSNNSYKTNHYATCSVCKGTKSASHSITTKYVTWNGDRHWLYDYCKTCGYEYNTGNYESHSISWGSWQNKSAGCYRSGKCSKCTYTTSQSKSSHSYTVSVTCKNGTPATVKKCSYCGRCSRCGATH